MELSKQKGNIFDPFRQAWVVANPEEIVRQKLLHVMTTQLGFPRELLAIEMQLSEIPHLKGVPNLPKRRIDIICFGKKIHPQHSLYPLLVIECKEGEVGEEAKSQVLGYNHYIQAKFVAIAGKNVAQLIYPEQVPFLPPYSQLCR